MTRHLAQLNVSRLVASTDDPRVADVMGNLDRIKGLGSRMSGFGWRHLAAARLWRTRACAQGAA